MAEDPKKKNEKPSDKEDKGKKVVDDILSFKSLRKKKKPTKDAKKEDKNEKSVRRATDKAEESMRRRKKKRPVKSQDVTRLGGQTVVCRSGEKIDEDEDCLPEPWKGNLSEPTLLVIDAFVKKHTTLGVQGLRDEFAKWKGWVPPRYQYDRFIANLEKNRYRDVVCLDHTRIKLSLHVPPETDYIHANLVCHEGADKRFICCQGPLDTTIGDHWRLMHQEGVSVVVNLCQFIESGKFKCAQYWPMKEGEYVTYGKMYINNKKVINDGYLDIYTVEALPEGCSNSTIMKLIHMTNWPDRGVPSDPKILLRILRLMYLNAQGQIVVHCSAGIGRTGTIVGVDIIIERLLKGIESNLVDVFQSLRSQRASSIQTESQYVFVVQVVLEYIRIKTGKKHEDAIKKFHDEVVKANLV